MEHFEETLSSQELYSGKIVTLRKDTVRLEDGRQTLREVVVHPGGVCVLALEEDNTTYIVRQFRYPFFLVTTELPAGKLDGPEDPEKAARRELSEEVGVEAESLVYLGGMLASPGFCTEVLHIFLARGLRHGRQHLDEGEFLTAQRVPFRELFDRVMKGEIVDMKTVCAVLKVREYLCREGHDPLSAPQGQLSCGSAAPRLLETVSTPEGTASSASTAPKEQISPESAASQAKGGAL